MENWYFPVFEGKFVLFLKNLQKIASTQSGTLHFSKLRQIIYHSRPSWHL